jgi:hypothetical protein
VRFHRIVWNHPHLGVENFSLHRFLMAHFFHSARGALIAADNAPTQVIVSLVEGQEERWTLTQQAQQQSFAYLRHDAFREACYPGYVCKRNNTAASFKNSHTKQHMGSVMPSFTYRYVRAADDGSDVSKRKGTVERQLASTATTATTSISTTPARLFKPARASDNWFCVDHCSQKQSVLKAHFVARSAHDRLRNRDLSTRTRAQCAFDVSCVAY